MASPVLADLSSNCEPPVPATTVAVTPALAWLICAATPDRLEPASMLMLTAAAPPGANFLPKGSPASSLQVPSCSVSVPAPRLLPVATAVEAATWDFARSLTSTENEVTAAPVEADADTTALLDEVTVRAVQVDDCASLNAASDKVENSDCTWP